MVSLLRINEFSGAGTPFTIVRNFFLIEEAGIASTQSNDPSLNSTIPGDGRFFFPEIKNQTNNKKKRDMTLPPTTMKTFSKLPS
jgi:hypothetical protein